MIPVFIIWLIRRYRRNQHSTKNSETALKKLKKHLQHITVILLLINLFFGLRANSQNKLLSYQILRNRNKVGTLRFSEITNGGMDYLKMESDVKTKFIFTFTAHAKEEAVYYNGVLLRSSIYRQLNGNEKANKQHRADNRQYIILKGKDSAVTKNYPITYNMLSLYSKEPENLSRAYSDNFETFLSIQKVDIHKYKITLPDGNYNYYCYKDGVLGLVEVHHSLYSASIVLVNN